jgi:2-isopropylmalate synthase
MSYRSRSCSGAGVGLVQGTINGIGECTGNDDLCSIVPSLARHVNTTLSCETKLFELNQLSRYVVEIMNRGPNSAAPL